MIALPGGYFIAGSDRHYPEERPARAAHVGPFRIARAPVTVAEFAAFVAATGYATLAERDGAGGIVFVPGASWWQTVPGAHWRSPEGAAQAEDDHPVTQVALEDAQAYAAWAGLALPTEAEWEYAAWGGRFGTEYAWGDDLEPGGRHMANIWQGAFPFANTEADGYARTSPVGRFPANGFGLVDMIGNVWEWTATPWTLPGTLPNKPCCAAGGGTARHVIKGGSHLCAPSYCRRYRPAARQGQAVDSGTSHLGFRCVRRDGGAAPA